MEYLKIAYRLVGLWKAVHLLLATLPDTLDLFLVAPVKVLLDTLDLFLVASVKALLDTLDPFLVASVKALLDTLGLFLGDLGHAPPHTHIQSQKGLKSSGKGEDEVSF